MQVAMMEPQFSYEQMQAMPSTTYSMMAPQVGYEQTQAMPSMSYSMAPQTMGGAAGITFVAEPVATGMMMEQQPMSTRIEAMPGATYSAPAATTYLAGAQPNGVMMGGTTMMGGAVQQEGFLQHAMNTVETAFGLGGSQTNTTYVQGGQAGTTYIQGGTAYGQGGGMTIASPAGGVVTYGAPGAMSTTTTGGYAVGGAGSANLFDQIDANHDGVISRAEFAQVMQQ